jgi:hypothetical protein
VLLAVLALAAALPQAGLVVPGRTLGGVALGDTPAQVRARWGNRYGVCRRCDHRTWYFTYRAFAPAGAGVEFRGGRVVSAFTLWQPRGWHTSHGVLVGDPVQEVTAAYGPLFRVDCGAYYALTMRTRGVTTAVYVLDEKVWGFGLTRLRGPCR